MLDLLKKHFGYQNFRPLQEEIIQHVLANKDCLTLMPTGGGKSLCYQLPALALPGLTIVISPLISLMKDQVDALRANGIAAEFINSALSPGEIKSIERKAGSGQLKILYIAPERLAATGFADFLQLLNVSLIAIDEAHCISEWGHDFRPDYRKLTILRKVFPRVPVIALTATATAQVREDIIKQLNLRKHKVFISSFDRSNLYYRVLPRKNFVAQLLPLLEKYQNESVIIYCFSRKNTEELAESLAGRGLKAAPYHAGLDASLRKQTQEKFIKDEINIITATLAFGMGIDKPDVRLVIHCDLPKSVEGYYQETGRAGRDGLPAECVLFFSYADRRKQAYFIDEIEDDAEREKAWEKLEEMLRYGDLNTCRRRYLLRYFGQEYGKDNCGACDVCQEPVAEFDATEIAQKILSAVARTGQRFGGGYIAKVLLGEDDNRAKQLGHNKLSVFGIVDNFSRAQLMQLINSLAAKNLLRKTSGEYPVLSLTAAGKEFLKKRTSVNLPKPEARKRRVFEASATDESYDAKLFERLRTLRKQIANSLAVPPYVVFGDAPLREMAAYFPQSLSALGKISGVGSKKLQQFGDKFLEAIRAYAKERGLEEKQKADEPEVIAFGATYDKTRGLLLQKLPLAEIAKKRNLSLTTIVDHIDKLSAQEKALDIAHLRPPQERFAKIKTAFEQTGQLAVLSPAKTILGENFSYDEIKLARIFLRREG